MLAHCDKLTSDGKELTITWEGGNDNGWLTLRLDDQEIQTLNETENQIIRFVEDFLGYGSFAGDFSTDGKVTYDRENKCFIGEDNYSETSADFHECNIELCIPEQIWFDSLALNLESDGDLVNSSIELRIMNGPYPQAFESMQKDIERKISECFMEITDHLENFAGLWEDLTIRRASFQPKDGLLRYQIHSFTYNFYEYDVKPVLLHFE